MRVIEQLVQHFWTRGVLSVDEVRYLVKHGFVREADLVGFASEPYASERGTRDIDEDDQRAHRPRDWEEDQERKREEAEHREWEQQQEEARRAEELEDELVGRNAAGGRKGGKKKPAGHNLAPAATVIAAHLASREPYPALVELGCRLKPCPTWGDAAIAIAAATPKKLETALVGLLAARPRALGELWFWFDLEPLFVWAESSLNVGPVAEGIKKLLRAERPAQVGRLEQLKKAPEVQALIELLAARKPFLGMLPVLYSRYFDKLALWLIPPAGVAARVWPSLPWTFVLVYNAQKGTADVPPPGYVITTDWWVLRDALRTALPIDPTAVRELFLHHLRERPDPMPSDLDLMRNMVFDRPLYCPLTWKV